MPALKTLLIDDEATSLRSLKYELETYCKDVQVVGTIQDPVEAVRSIGELNPDLVFLDIEMPVMNGFEVLQSFSSINFDVIFVTAYDQFAVRAFEFNAVDYLLKPVLKSKLIQSVQKVAERQSHHFEQVHLEALMHNVNRQNEKADIDSIAIPTQEGFELIHVDKIWYLLAEGNYTWVNIETGEKYLVSKTLKEVTSMINRNHFFRAHKSYLVNLKHVRRYVRGRGGYLVLENGDTIPVSRNQRSELMKVLNM